MYLKWIRRGPLIPILLPNDKYYDSPNEGAPRMIIMTMMLEKKGNAYDTYYQNDSMTKTTKLSILCKHKSDKLIFETYLYFLAMILFSKRFQSQWNDIYDAPILCYVYFNIILRW